MRNGLASGCGRRPTIGRYPGWLASRRPRSASIADIQAIVATIASKLIQESGTVATSWTFLTNHARVLLCISRDPGIRLRDIASSVGVTERSAYAIVQDLAEAGYIIKDKDGRRNRYRIEADLPLPEPSSQERTVGEVLALLAGRDQLPAGQ